jgi:plasmid maintenance system antidote protein VapI
MLYTLKQAIRHSCFTQKKIALLIDVDKFHFNKLVNNNENISDKIIQKLIKIKELELKECDLIQENKNRKARPFNRQVSASSYWL